ncbi:MAG: helix-turn-helix transcriptional regulator [Candidatus Aminicenantes bacterium]|nr:MAG: helix-turn-helix transcriptional regulator [Candidatus Aminicenantes bacterium]
MLEENNIEVGNRIKQTRKALNLRQKDLTQKLNISVPYFLYHLERSSILQYFILNQYKTKMMMEPTPVLKEIEAYEKKQKK